MSRSQFQRDGLFLLLAGVLTAAALAGLLARPPALAAWLIALGLLVLLGYAAWWARTSAQRGEVRLALPALLAAHLACGLSGGLRSPTLLVYPLLLALVALLSRRLVVVVWAALLVPILELVAALPLEPDEGPRLTLLAASWLALVGVVQLARRHEWRRLEQLSDELERLGRAGEELGEIGLEGASSRAAVTRRMERGEQLSAAVLSLLELARLGLGARSVALLRRADEGLVIRHVVGAREGLTAGRGLPLEQGSCALALRECRPLCLSRASGLAELRALVKGEAPRAALLVPVAEGRHGLLLAESDVADRFQREATELAGRVALELETQQERLSELWGAGERTAELADLSEASRQLAASQELDQAASVLLERAHQLAPCERGCVLLGTPSGDLQLVASRGFAGGLPERSEAGSRSWARWILEHEGPGLLLESRDSPMPLVAPGEPQSGRNGALLGAQLRVQDRVVGVLLLEGDEPHIFDAHSFRLITILSNQAASSLETARVLREMRQLAVTDGLTGLANHRHFQQLLASEVARAERGSGVFSLLLLDLDHFKLLNDQYGHPAGDAVLREVARRLRSEARAGDTVARYGGEEFALILPDAAAERALTMAGRIRQRMASEPVTVASHALDVTLSVGVAAYPAHASDSRRLVERADEALYRAKNQGRNRAVLAEREAEALPPTP